MSRFGSLYVPGFFIGVQASLPKFFTKPKGLALTLVRFGQNEPSFFLFLDSHFRLERIYHLSDFVDGSRAARSAYQEGREDAKAAKTAGTMASLVPSLISLGGDLSCFAAA